MSLSYLPSMLTSEASKSTCPPKKDLKIEASFSSGNALGQADLGAVNIAISTILVSRILHDEQQDISEGDYTVEFRERCFEDGS